MQCGVLVDLWAAPTQTLVEPTPSHDMHYRSCNVSRWSKFHQIGDNADSRSGTSFHLARQGVIAGQLLHHGHTMVRIAPSVHTM